MGTIPTCDVAIVGGGIIGAAIAWGLARAGASVAVIDGDDGDFRASVGNFGLIGVQSKAAGSREYVAWTHTSALLWQAFADELTDFTGIDFALSQKGGFSLYLSEADAEARRKQIASFGDKVQFRIDFLEREALLECVPDIGPEVIGGSFCALDGELNPLLFLSALHAGITAKGGKVLFASKVGAVVPVGKGFEVAHATGRIAAGQVVVAAGLASAGLAAPLGIELKLFPQRGQVMVTERVERFLQYPNTSVRQTADGTVMLGSTQENVGFDKSVALPSLKMIARRATRFFPRLRSVKVVRSWGCLRIMTPDGAPIYGSSADHEGLFFATAHSGVTLAAAHAHELAPAIAEGRLPERLASFAADRFARGIVHGEGTDH